MADDLLIRARLVNEVSGPAKQAQSDVKGLAAETTKVNAEEKALTATHSKQSQEVQKLHQRILGLSGTLGGAFASGLKLAGIGLLGITAAAGFFGLKAASSFQQTRVAFDTMLGSVEAGGALFAKLQALNLKSPFELSQITQATQVLLRYGVSASTVVDVTKGIANAAALSGPRMVENLDRISLAIGQVQAKGKLQGEEARQLAEAGINAYGIYERKLGLTRAQVEKLGEAGKLSGDILLTAVAQGDLGIQGLDQAAEKLSQTLGGQFSNLKDLLNVGLADAAQPLVGTLSTLIGTPDKPGALVAGIQALVTNVGPPVFTLIGKVADLLVKALPIIGPLLDAAVSGIGTLLDAAGPALADLNPVVDALGASIGVLVTALVPVMPDLVRGFVDLVKVLPAFVTLLADLVPLVDPILRLLDKFLELPGVTNLLAITLAGLLGYRAVAGVVGGVRNLAGAINLTAAAEEREAAARGLTGGGLAALGVGALGVGIAADSLHRKPSTGAALETAAGFALTGAAIGSVIPGPGTALGAAIGGGAGFVGGLAFGLGRRDSQGDTPSRKNLANTLAGHQFASAMSPGPRISNIGAGINAGSDHVAGRALDLVGPNLLGYAQAVRGAGGYADFHGSHLHAVMGDTPSSRRSSSTSARADGAVIVDIHDNTFAADVDVATAVQTGIARERRERKERD